MRSNSYTDNTKPENSVDVIKNANEKQKIHDKHLKLIEDQMIQSKQEGRGFKRQEGEVKKEQRSIRLAIRELETGKYSDKILLLILFEIFFATTLYTRLIAF